ncbi:MAG: TonB-dependent receptor [Arachidicoccus sp.]|nr:TonB-dependent receptor [Arachidicoccus sp.]
MKQKLLFLCGISFFILLSITALSQSKTITGTVADSLGNGISGVSVKVRGRARGTMTNIKGFFSLQANTGDILTFAAINYEPQEINIGEQNVINISLKIKSSELSDVVVVAYGTQRKVNVTGSMVTIDSKQIEDKPFTSVDKALQGAVAGVQVSSANGIPGSSTDVIMRGIGSITAGTSPLWVIDGVAATTGDLTSNTTTSNALSGLNPDDIESITPLKDAAATALYGSRAANGVMIVVTKKGKSGGIRLNATAEIGYNKIAHTNKNNRPMTTLENQTVLRESLINAGYASNNSEADELIIDPENGLGFDSNWTQTNTNWLDAVTRTGKQRQYNASVSGGTEKTQYYASAGYFDQDGTTIATTFKRYNGSFSLNSKVNDKITFKLGVNGSTSTQLSPLGSAAYGSPVSGSFFLQPWFSPYNSDGSLRYGDAEFPNGAQFNPVAIANFEKQNAIQTEFRGYVSGEYQILPELKFTSKYGAEYFDINEYQYWSPFYGDGFNDQGDGFAVYTRLFDWTWTNQLNYRLNITHEKDIYVDLLGGTEAYRITNNILEAGAKNFPMTSQLFYLASASTPTTAYNLPSAQSMNSYFSNAIFNFKDRYIISGSFRRDGSSVFSQGHKWGNFYSAGASWNINEESFMKYVKWINLLKLRGSYGETGNTNGFGYYSALSTYSYGYPYNGNPGSAPNNVGNSNLTWEKNKQFNVGVDFSFVNDRLGGTIEYYKRVSSDLIVAVPLSPTSGFSGGQNENVGSMYNRGLEFTLNGKPVVSKDFSWTINFNISHNTNRVTKLYNHSPISQQTRFEITEGHDIHEFYTRLWAGVNPDNGSPLWYTDATRADTTSNSSLAQLSLTGKSASPKYFGGFSNIFQYKSISLDIDFYYNFGNYIYNTWENYLSSDGLYLGSMNQMSTELNAWQKPGDRTNTPQIIYGGNKNSNRPSTRYLYSGNYIRLRNIQLSYALPKIVLNKIKLSNLSVYVRGTNLFTFDTDKYLPNDPELGASSIQDFQVFIPKSITFGLKVGL